MDPAYQLEQALMSFNNLSDSKRRKILINSAGMREHAIGNTACQDLADFINELVEENTSRRRIRNKIK